MMNIIFVNGPPRSGKDTVGKYLIDEGWNPDKFAYPIRAMLRGFGVTGVEFDRIKDDSEEEFMGMSWRQVAISFSEDWAKRKFGDGIFGQLCANRCITDYNDINARTFVLTDCGFREELFVCDGALRTWCRLEGIKYESMLLRVHRPGYSYLNDSRSRVDALSGMIEAEITNDHTIEVLYSRLDTIIRAAFEE